LAYKEYIFQLKIRWQPAYLSFTLQQQMQELVHKEVALWAYSHVRAYKRLLFTSIQKENDTGLKLLIHHDINISKTTLKRHRWMQAMLCHAFL